MEQLNFICQKWGISSSQFCHATNLCNNSHNSRCLTHLQYTGRKHEGSTYAKLLDVKASGQYRHQDAQFTGEWPQIGNHHSARSVKKSFLLLYFYKFIQYLYTFIQYLYNIYTIFIIKLTHLALLWCLSRKDLILL